MQLQKFYFIFENPKNASARKFKLTFFKVVFALFVNLSDFQIKLRKTSRLLPLIFIIPKSLTLNS